MNQKSKVLIFGVFVIGILIWFAKFIYNPVGMSNSSVQGETSNYEASLMKSQKFATSGDSVRIEYVYEANTVVLKFPLNQPAPVGKVMFFLASDKRKDRGFDLKTDPSKQMFIHLDGFEKGTWRILVEWQGEDKIYSQEDSINVQPNDWARPLH